MNKIIFDPLYGPIELTKKCLQIIDTKEFQRLRCIKQLGSCYYVFPGAVHNRFEHSIGVCFLAKELLTNLLNKQPEIEICNEIKECIPIAGLCHDLGHGPFSHCFDNDFLSKYMDKKNKLFHHENRSIIMLNYIVKKYNIDLNEKQLYIISELIYPQKMDLEPKFIYNIVSNPINGIDVDKFDYIKRDTHNIGLSYSFSYQRIFKYARIIEDKICYPIKMIYEIKSLFDIRHRLHKEIYTHPVTKSIDLMISDILLLVNSKFNIVDSLNNIELFSLLNDNILYLIENSNYKCKDLEKAKDILNRIYSRDLYIFIGNINLKSTELVYDNIQTILKILDIKIEEEIENNLLLVPINLSYNFNPLNNISLYKKNGNNFEITKNLCEESIVTNITDIQLRFYCKNKKFLKKSKKIFDKIKTKLVK